jgi:glucose-1-phosphate cytidylyltransferase
MKAVILAGGLGTRISEESVLRPKPMIEIGGKPILWHIMKTYSHFGINDFVICCGYKGYMIKEYFANYSLHNSDVTFDLKDNSVKVHQNSSEPWTITIVDTGESTQTGGRLKRVARYLGDSDFCLTYGDGVSDVNIKELIAFHKNHRKLATVTAVHPPGRFGMVNLDENSRVIKFNEKPLGDGALINGGFFVLSPKVIDFISGDMTMWEKEPLEELAARNELMAYIHRGFWQPMDTLRDKNQLEQLLAKKEAPWVLW